MGDMLHKSGRTGGCWLAALSIALASLSAAAAPPLPLRPDPLLRLPAEIRGSVEFRDGRLRLSPGADSEQTVRLLAAALPTLFPQNKDAAAPQPQLKLDMNALLQALQKGERDWNKTGQALLRLIQLYLAKENIASDPSSAETLVGLPLTNPTSPAAEEAPKPPPQEKVERDPALPPPLKIPWVWRRNSAVANYIMAVYHNLAGANWLPLYALGLRPQDLLPTERVALILNDNGVLSPQLLTVQKTDPAGNLVTVEKGMIDNSRLAVWQNFPFLFLSPRHQAERIQQSRDLMHDIATPFASIQLEHQLLLTVPDLRELSKEEIDYLIGLSLQLQDWITRQTANKQRYSQEVKNGDLAEISETIRIAFSLLEEAAGLLPTLINRPHFRPENIAEVLAMLEGSLRDAANLSQDLSGLKSASALPSEIIAACNYIAASNHARLPIEVQVAPGTSPLAVPAFSAWRVLTNLVNNAAEAGARHLTINLQNDGPVLLLRAADDGPGIDPQLLPNIFERGVSSKGPGRGHGLNIVRNLVKKDMGGAIEVESSPGQGTTFTMALPRDPKNFDFAAYLGQRQARRTEPATAQVAPEENTDADTQEILRLRGIMHDLAAPLATANAWVSTINRETAAGKLVLTPQDGLSLSTWLGAFAGLIEQHDSLEGAYAKAKSAGDIQAMLVAIQEFKSLQPTLQQVQRALTLLQQTINHSILLELLNDTEHNLGDFAQVLQALEGSATSTTAGIGDRLALKKLFQELIIAFAGRIAITTEIDPSAANIEVNSTALNLALRNLAKNAAEAGANELTIRAVLRDGVLQLAVHDNGPGIPSNLFPDPDSIFEQSVSSKGAGRGLGLWIVRDELQRRLGGTIKANNDPRGGAIFTIAIPSSAMLLSDADQPTAPKETRLPPKKETAIANWALALEKLLNRYNALEQIYTAANQRNDAAAMADALGQLRGLQNDVRRLQSILASLVRTVQQPGVHQALASLQGELDELDHTVQELPNSPPAEAGTPPR